MSITDEEKRQLDKNSRKLYMEKTVKSGKSISYLKARNDTDC